MNISMLEEIEINTLELIDDFVESHPWEQSNNILGVEVFSQKCEGLMGKVMKNFDFLIAILDLYYSFMLLFGFELNWFLI